MSLPINFTGTVCPMIKQYKSKYMNLETLASLRKNKLNNNTNNNNDKSSNKNGTVDNKTPDATNNGNNNNNNCNNNTLYLYIKILIPNNRWQFQNHYKYN